MDGLMVEALDAFPKESTEQVAYLKNEHGMGHGHANAVVHVYRQEHPAG